jgi:hypothetical protein
MPAHTPESMRFVFERFNFFVMVMIID